LVEACRLEGLGHQRGIIRRVTELRDLLVTGVADDQGNALVRERRTSNEAPCRGNSQNNVPNCAHSKSMITLRRQSFNLDTQSL
jgi:hypothetical protein